MLFVFFKQKTAYELRISDWSSDVCSSDLAELLQRVAQRPGPGRRRRAHVDDDRAGLEGAGQAVAGVVAVAAEADLPHDLAVRYDGDDHVRHRGERLQGRSSEERRVGKECVSTFRSRGSPYT